ncbi:polysaccharide lyase family 7 protein [Gilvimarinus agarilyticus]|uniref:polysaccharide lyase family 7 protein n=1 Tax=Gilvimarinus sp. 2_MG-2023 TaxID=3062666 RepID=UPI001C08B3D7|nr:polysaccharide lyase family 7 protein [Gilvimarinus sp. 2_MG-2023]MBU2886524.1 polysaccharide lyase family 7 protein [Gilvimarinus agarilyticus]MDO6571192.1 polysaccharide lyase family 7 protein [Gilvimarinus sp. 2_MG-2023]
MIKNVKKTVRAMPIIALSVVSSVALLTACQGQTETKQSSASQPSLAGKRIPGSVIDLSQWKITLPMDSNRDGKIDEVGPPHIDRLLEPRFFYATDAGVVFAAPNKAVTTSGSTNTRSELRQMIDAKGSTKAPGNNFALAAHPKASRYGSIGGKLSATLAVNHVAVEAKNPNKKPAFSVVVGQIHAGKDSKMAKGFGYGNEPLKIYYKKWPDHEYGSVFWTYERNLEQDDPNRTDIAFPVWGNVWDNPEDPGEAGLKLDETFSYVVDVDGSVMNLTFTGEGKQTIEYSVDLSNNVDPYGKVDELDNPKGYSGDWFYFKAGAYNQCSSKDQEGMWYAGCAGTGLWEKDSQAGHYAQATFRSITLN